MNQQQDRSGRRLDAYIRVSSVAGREGDTFISPDVQKEKIGQWAAFKGHEIVVVHEEMDQSGRKASRPKLDEMMRRIRDGETDGVVVWKCSRFGRNMLNSLTLIREIDKADAMFASATEEFDTSTRMGRLMLHIMLAFAEDESEGLRESWLTAKAKAVERGVHVSANVPFGYIRPRGDANPRTGRQPTLPLEPDPDTAWMVPELFRMRAAGESWETLRRWLASNDAPTVRGQPWAASTLMGMIKNRVYLGEARGAGADLAAKGAHQPLVDEATWLAAQGRRGPRFVQSETGALLRGLVRCGSCRYAMQTRKGQYQRADAVDYLCNSRVGCPHPAVILGRGVNGTVGVDDVVVDMVRVWEQQRAEAIEFDGFDERLDVDALEQELAGLTLSRERDRLDEDLQAALGRQEWLKHLADLTGRVNEKQAELEETLRQRGLPDGMPTAEFWDKWRSGEMSLEEKRAHLASVIQAVFVSPANARGGGRDDDSRRRRFANRVHVVWATDEPLVEIPRQGYGGYRIKPWPFPVGADPDVSRVVALQPQVEDAGEAVG